MPTYRGLPTIVSSGILGITVWIGSVPPPLPPVGGAIER